MRLVKLDAESCIADDNRPRLLGGVSILGSAAGADKLRTGHLIDGRALQKLAEKLNEEGLGNVDFVVGASDDPKLPAHTFDAILISNAYHEFTEPRAMLKHVREALKRGGKLVVIEAISPEMRDKI